jgi:hypothetical protein
LPAGVSEGAAAETGLPPAPFAPEELSIGVSEVPRHAPLGLMVTDRYQITSHEAPN